MLSAALVVGSGAVPGGAPLRLAVYYGYPSLVNGAAGRLDVAVAAFAPYDVVMLGDGLEFGDGAEPRMAGAREHAFVRTLIERLHHGARKTRVFGYVDLGHTQQLSLAAVADRIARWSDTGADGVLLDEAGYDFGVTRTRQNTAIRLAHARGLSACLNAYRLADVFGGERVPLNANGGGNPDGLATILSARDAVLLESFAVRNGIAESPARTTARIREALQARAVLGTRLFALGTAADDNDAAPASYGWWAAAAASMDAYGWGTPAYGAPDSRLPWVARPAAEATLQDAVSIALPVFDDGRWRRRTTAGLIVVDAQAHRGSLERVR